MKKNITQPFRILAIALSTSGFGFAVMEGERNIIDCGGRVVKGDNSQSLAKFEKLLKSYQPDVLVLQDVEDKDVRRAPRIKRLNQKIEVLAEKNKIQVNFISAKQMRILLLGNTKGTKQEIAERLALQFPDELGSRLPPKRKPWKSEDSRMDIFEAVALGVAYCAEGI